MSALSDTKIDIKLKLSALWASTMLCYMYCDYFELYTPGKLDSMLRGKIGPLGDATDGVLLGTSLLMAVPSLMVFLSVALPARANRITSIVVGAFYTLLMALIAVVSSWYFYRFFAAVEMLLTATVVVLAWRWPRLGRAG